MVSQLMSAHLPCLKELVLEGSNMGNEGEMAVAGKFESAEQQIGQSLSGCTA